MSAKFFIIMKILILKILLAGLSALTVVEGQQRRYDYGYHPSAEEYDGLLKEASQTWTHQILKEQREQALQQKNERYFVPKFRYENDEESKKKAWWNKKSQHKISNKFDLNPESNNINNKISNKFDLNNDNFHYNIPQSMVQKKPAIIQNLSSSLDFQLFSNELPQPIVNYGITNTKADDYDKGKPQMVADHPEFFLQPELNLKPIRKPDSLDNSLEKYSLNNLYKNNSLAKFPIYFTNPATGIVYAISEIGKSTKNHTEPASNGTIPIFISKEQYERDILLLRREYENKCAAASQGSTAQPLMAPPSDGGDANRLTFSRPDRNKTTARPQIIRLQRPSSTAVLNYAPPLRKPSPVTVKTELTVKDIKKTATTTPRPPRRKPTTTKKKKKIKKSKRPGRKPLKANNVTLNTITVAPNGPQIIVGSTKKPYISRDKLSTQLEKPTNFQTTIFSSQPIDATSVYSLANEHQQNLNQKLFQLGNHHRQRRSLQSTEQQGADREQKVFEYDRPTLRLREDDKYKEREAVKSSGSLIDFEDHIGQVRFFESGDKAEYRKQSLLEYEKYLWRHRTDGKDIEKKALESSKSSFDLDDNHRKRRSIESTDKFLEQDLRFRTDDIGKKNKALESTRSSSELEDHHMKRRTLESGEKTFNKEFIKYDKSSLRFKAGANDKENKALESSKNSFDLEDHYRERRSIESGEKFLNEEVIKYDKPPLGFKAAGKDIESKVLESSRSSFDLDDNHRKRRSLESTDKFLEQDLRFRTDDIGKNNKVLESSRSSFEIEDHQRKRKPLVSGEKYFNENFIKYDKPPSKLKADAKDKENKALKSTRNSLELEDHYRERITLESGEMFLNEEATKYDKPPLGFRTDGKDIENKAREKRFLESGDKFSNEDVIKFDKPLLRSRPHGNDIEKKDLESSKNSLDFEDRGRERRSLEIEDKFFNEGATKYDNPPLGFRADDRYKKKNKDLERSKSSFYLEDHHEQRRLLESAETVQKQENTKHANPSLTLRSYIKNEITKSSEINKSSFDGPEEKFSDLDEKTDSVRQSILEHSKPSSSKKEFHSEIVPKTRHSSKEFFKYEEIPFGLNRNGKVREQKVFVTKRKLFNGEESPIASSTVNEENIKQSFSEQEQESISNEKVHSNQNFLDSNHLDLGLERSKMKNRIKRSSENQTVLLKSKPEVEINRKVENYNQSNNQTGFLNKNINSEGKERSVENEIIPLENDKRSMPNNHTKMMSKPKFVRKKINSSNKISNLNATQISKRKLKRKNTLNRKSTKRKRGDRNGQAQSNLNISSNYFPIAKVTTQRNFKAKLKKKKMSKNSKESKEYEDSGELLDIFEYEDDEDDDGDEKEQYEDNDDDDDASYEDEDDSEESNAQAQFQDYTSEEEEALNEQTPDNSSSAEEGADFGALEENTEQQQQAAVIQPTPKINVQPTLKTYRPTSTKHSPIKKIRIRRRPPLRKSDKIEDDYDDDDGYDGDDDEDTGISSNVGGFFRMIFYPIQALMYGLLDNFSPKDDKEEKQENLYTQYPPQYTSYHNTLKSDDYDDDDYDDEDDSSSSTSSLTSWLGSWFGLNRRNKKIGSTTAAPPPAKPTKSSGWFNSWFGANDRVDVASTEDYDDYDKWFASWFGEIRPKARKRTTTTTTSTTTQLPHVPILTIVDPMKNPQNWIGILAHHIINQNSSTTSSPLKQIWAKATTENPEVPRRISYDKYQIWRLKPQDDGQVKALEEYKKGDDGIRLQWLKGPTLRGLTDVLVPPKMFVDFQGSLAFESIDHEVLIFDVGKAIAYEKSKEDYYFTTTQRPKKHPTKAPLTAITWRKYYEYDDIIQYLENMRMRYPQLVDLMHIGRSYEGRPLIVAKIESKEAAALNSEILEPHQKTKLKHKKRIGMANAVFIEAGTHGLEWIGPATATWIINELLKIMKTNKTTDEQNFIRNTTWYIMPILNPDGYVYSHEFDRFWKKTRSRHISRQTGLLNSAMTWLKKKKTKEKTCFGVDLDRNWHYQWGRKGSSRTACNEFFAGPGPFSEPETKALSEFLMDYRSQIKLYISMQAYGQIISYPHKANSTFDNERLEDLLDVAMVGTDVLRRKGSKARYKIDSTNDLVESRSGCSDAFAAYEAGIPFSYTLHLADNGVHGYLLPSAGIESTAKDAFEIITGMLDYI